MTHAFLKKAGCKNIEEFYKKYPTEDKFFKKFPSERPKAQAGAQVGPPSFDQWSYENNMNPGTGNVINLPSNGDYTDQLFQRDPPQLTPEDNATGLNATGPMPKQGGYQAAQGQVFEDYKDTGVQPVTGKGQPKFKLNVKNPLKSKNWNPDGGVNTNDLFAGATALIAGALPYQKPKDNINPYNMAIPMQGQGSHATAKYGKKISKAADGAVLNWDNWNNMHSYLAKNDPNYGTDTLNHGQFANPQIEAYNQANPNQAIPLSDISKYQQAAIGNPEIKMPFGQSKVEGIPGQKTTGYSHREYEVGHYDPKGAYVKEHNYGTNQAGATADINNWKQSFGQTSQQPVTPVSEQAQPIQQTPVESPYVQAPKIKKPQKSNFFIQGKAGKTDYSLDSVREKQMMAGGPITIGEEGGTEIYDGEYKHESPYTIQLLGNSHDEVDPKTGETGQRIGHAGNVVEAEGPNGDSTGVGETLHEDPRSGDNIVGGNLHSSVGPKYKELFIDLAKQEKKSFKLQKLSANLLNTYNDQTKMGQHKGNSGKVISDAFETKKAKTDAVKNYFTDEQQHQLNVAEHLGINPKHVHKKLYGGKTMKDGGTIPKAQNGKKIGDDVFDQDNYPNKIQNTQYVPHHKQDSPGGKPRKKIVAKSSDNNKPYDINNPYFAPKSNGRNQPGLPYTFNQGDMEALPIIRPDVEVPQPVPARVYDNNPLAAQNDINKVSSKAPYKGAGMRNKFDFSQYLPEAATMFEQPETYPGMQERAFLETPYNISLQDKKNSIISAYQSALKGAANNPAIAAGIAGQMAQQLASVDSEELQVNQQNRGSIEGRNIQQLNHTQDVNTQLAQESLKEGKQAIANTKDDRFRAVEAVSAGEAQRRAQNNQLKMAENYYGWAASPDGQYHLLHPDYEFGPHPVSLEDLEPIKKKDRVQRGSKGTTYTEDTEKEAKYGGKFMAGGMMGGSPTGVGQMASRGSMNWFSEVGNYKKKNKKKQTA